MNSTEIETRLLLWRHVRERWRSRPFCGAFSRVGRERRRRRRRRRDEKPLEKEGREAYSFVFARPTAHVLRSEISSASQASTKISPKDSEYSCCEDRVDGLQKHSALDRVAMEIDLPNGKRIETTTHATSLHIASNSGSAVRAGCECNK